MQICLSEFIRILTARANNAPFLTCTSYVIRSTSCRIGKLQECQNSGCYLMMKPISSFDVFRQWINLHTNGFRFQFFSALLHETIHFCALPSFMNEKAKWFYGELFSAQKNFARHCAIVLCLAHSPLFTFRQWNHTWISNELELLKYPDDSLHLPPPTENKLWKEKWIMWQCVCGTHLCVAEIRNSERKVCLQDLTTISSALEPFFQRNFEAIRTSKYLQPTTEMRALSLLAPRRRKNKNDSNSI